jgi:hypothetical protein
MHVKRIGYSALSPRTPSSSFVSSISPHTETRRIIMPSKRSDALPFRLLHVQQTVSYASQQRRWSRPPFEPLHYRKCEPRLVNYMICWIRCLSQIQACACYSIYILPSIVYLANYNLLPKSWILGVFKEQGSSVHFFCQSDVTQRTVALGKTRLNAMRQY